MQQLLPVLQGQFSKGKYHGIGCLTMEDGREYKDVQFVDGELQHAAIHMELDYPKTVNKKKEELPVPFEVGSVVRAEFRISVRVLCTSPQPDTDADGVQPSAADTQTMTAESGRSVYLYLQQGHEEPEAGMQPVNLPVFKSQRRTTTPPEATSTEQDGAIEEAPAGVVSLCAITTAGECSFEGFQIGGEGLESLEAGPYTLVVSSIGLPDARILVQLTLPKGKKK